MKKTGSAKRKSTGKKKKPRVSGSASVGNTVTIKGIGRFAKKSCHATKSAAEKMAEALRSPAKGRGKLARVIKNGKAFCVFEGRTRKQAFGH